MNSSIRRWSFGDTQSSALNSPESRSPRGTCAAIRDGRSETSNDWIARIPDSPSRRRLQHVIEADAERRHEPHAGNNDPSHAGQASRADGEGRTGAEAAAAARIGVLCTFSYAPR